MAKFKFTGTLIVEGEDIRTKNDAITELQVMLDDYDDMNPNDSSVIIHWDKVEKIVNAD